jgi:hypothetical protein
MLSSIIYSTLIAENYDSEQKWQYRNIKLFLLEMFEVCTISAQTRIMVMHCGIIFWEILYILSRAVCVCDHRRGLDWLIDLLTTYRS